MKRPLLQSQIYSSLPKTFLRQMLTKIFYLILGFLNTLIRCLLSYSLETTVEWSYCSRHKIIFRRQC
jgi:hypothetical protein